MDKFILSEKNVDFILVDVLILLRNSANKCTKILKWSTVELASFGWFMAIVKSPRMLQ